MNESRIQQTTNRFKAAVTAGKIRELVAVWSPALTLHDTRYQYVDNNGETHILHHYEASGFLARLGV